MSPVDREAPVDPTTEAVELHNRLRDFQPALERRLGELGVTGATQDERLGLGVMREHLQAVSAMAQAAIVAISEADIPHRDNPEEILASAQVRNIVRDFANQRGGGFTARDLKEYLSELGIELPKDHRAFQRYFAGWQDQIVAERASAGEKRCWVKLNPRTYALAWLGSPPVAPPPESVSKIALATPSSTAPQPALPPKHAPPPAPPRLRLTVEDAGEVALRLVAESPDDHGGVLVNRLAEQAGNKDDISSAWLVFNQLVDGGKIREEKVGETVFFRPVSPASPEGDSETAEDPAATAALRLVHEASEEPAKILIGRLVGEMNISTPAARRVFEKLVENGQIYRRNDGGRVRYSAEPPDPQPARPNSLNTEVAEKAATPPSEVVIQTAQQVLEAFTGRGLSFGTALSPQEIARKISGTADESNITVEDVKAAANYLWSLGFVTRIEAQGRLKLQLANRSIMAGMKSEQERADMLEQVTKGKTFTPPAEPIKRRPTKKRR